MTAPTGLQAPAARRRVGTTILAVATCGLAAATLLLPFDGEGLLRRPAPPAPPRRPWMVGPLSPLRPTWPATAEGLAAALAAADPAIDACHAAWVAVEPGAPQATTGVVRLARGPDGMAAAAEVRLENRPPGAAAMESCAKDALAGFAFTDAPPGDLEVRFSIAPGEAP